MNQPEAHDPTCDPEPLLTEGNRFVGPQMTQMKMNADERLFREG
jgi:hypothetical protein